MEFWHFVLIIIALLLTYVLAKLMYIKLDVGKKMKFAIITLSISFLYFMSYLSATNIFATLIILGIMVFIATLISILKL